MSFNVGSVLTCMHEAIIDVASSLEIPHDFLTMEILCMQGVMQYIQILETRLSTENGKMLDFKERRVRVLKDKDVLNHLIVADKKRSEAVPGMVVRLKAVAEALQQEFKSLEEIEDAQKSEYDTLADVLLTPCPKLSPTFVPTPTSIMATQFTFSSCPVCCNGYHCYNWVPASCGHTYHQSCLFPLIGASMDSPRCLACNALFSNEWLRSWGLRTYGEETRVSHIEDLKRLYGMHSMQLLKRRELGQHIQSGQGRVSRSSIVQVMQHDEFF